jgi:peptide-methionine (S)-S-oxide reductase
MTENKTQVKKIVLCGGCFWCTEAVFKELRGTTKVTSGYIGGAVESPTYAQVCSGKTGHAEGVEIEYDQSTLSTRDVLTVFFASHDPTTLNRQGGDTGTQYRSAIFYTDEDQRIIAEEIIADINSGGGDKVVTEILPYERFYSAEENHQDYYQQNKNKNPYCQVVINPKLEKLQSRFAELLKS